MAKSLTHCSSAEVLKPSLPTWRHWWWVRCYLETWKPGCFDKANVEMEFIRSNEINVVHFQGENYPRDWSIVSTVLLLLFTWKNWFKKPENNQHSWHAPNHFLWYGILPETNRFGSADPIIVSGFAYGVDIVAHQLAMEHNLQTIGVVAHGLNQIYPKTHKSMCKVEQNGGFMTEFWSTSIPTKKTSCVEIES
jgi:DNA processing protein